jgi:hypothetical protein
MRLGGCAAALAVLLAACNGGGHTRDTLPPTSSSTTATTVDYSIPAVIDAPYVTKVMQALDHILGDDIRLIAQRRTVDVEFLGRLRAIYGDRELRNLQDLWTKAAADGLRTLAPIPGDPKTTVQSLLRADATCVVLAVDRDFSPTQTTPRSQTPQRYIGLVPKPAGRDPSGINPTPWIMSFDGFITDGSAPREPCKLD